MALVDSNTFTEPTAGTSLNAARGQINNSLRSLLTNFRSTSAPSTVNLTADGDNIGAQNGMLYHHANNNVNALYISDSSTVKDAPVGGNFTRAGIGVRIENGIVPMMSNVTHYEIGELVVTTTADSGTAANARLYLNKSNNNTPADFIDVGIPPTNGSVVNTMIAVGGVTSDRMNFSFGQEFTSSPNNRKNAHIAIGSADGTNTAILLGAANSTSNVSLIKLHGGIGVDAGISIFDQTANYAPLSANVISQLTIQGTTDGTVATDVAPLIPAGSIIGWGGAAAPSGWLLCNGASISRNAYPALFAIIGTTFGNVDGNTFNVPDLQGRMLAGVGSSSTRGAKSSGQLGGSQFITTDSGVASLTAGTVDVSVGAKDAGGVTVINSVSAGGHTHTVGVPATTANYIIKT